MKILLKDLPEKIRENLEKYSYINKYNPKILDIRYKFLDIHKRFFYKKVCFVCGEIFFTNQNTLETCSKKCQEIYNKTSKKILSKLPLVFLNNLEYYKTKFNLKTSICCYCGNHFLVNKNENGYFCKRSCQISYSNKTNQTRKIKSSKRMKIKNPSKKGIENFNYKGACIQLYDLWAPKINWHDEVRRCPENPEYLEVKCTYCGRWHIPEIHALKNRVNRIEKDYSKIYCSQECKDNCPTYSLSGARLTPKGINDGGAREVQSELRKLVFQRDNYTCQKCGRDKNKEKFELHCHHINPVKLDPLESADINNCISLCKECHKEAHKKDGCGYRQLADCVNI